MKLLFVVNPISGGVNKKPFMAKAIALCDKYSINYHVFSTTGKNDMDNLKKVLPEVMPNKVVSVGGDGTTLFTGLALLGTEYPMGIIPLGSANGMATELFVNPDPLEALKDIIMSEKIDGLDLLKVNDKYYTLHIGDVGVNARIVEAYEKDKNRGMATYAKYFLEELKNLQPFAATVRVGNDAYRENVYMTAICNARKFGTGVPLNRTGNPMDGKFEIVLITRIDGPSLIKSGLARFDEKFLDNESGKVITTTNASIEFDQPRLLQLDGEVIGKFKEIKVEIIQHAIKIITHGDNKYLAN
jgi:diacylglycerol kinase (ATP)